MIFSGGGRVAWHRAHVWNSQRRDADSHARAIAIMPTLDDAFSTVCDALAEHFGPFQADFEGLAPFEAMIAVVLERELGGARWRAALAGLDDAGLLVPERLAQADLPEIGDALREKGISAPAYATALLKRIARWLVEHHGGIVDSLFDPHRSPDWLRGELASLSGIGVTGADAILLFALKQPSFPVDRATFRVLVRHDWLDPTETYEDARDLLVGHAVERADQGHQDPAGVLETLSLGMEQLGRRFCRVAAPLCDGCPLESLLPEGGPRQIDA
jgi:endonuclease-3 related protein